VAWHVYDIQLNGFERLTGADYHLARFSIIKDEGVRAWQVRVRIKPSVRDVLGERAAQYDDRDLGAGLAVQTILTLLENGLEAFEQDIVLDSSHYPGRPGEPAIAQEYRHLTVRVETTPEGEVIPPIGVSIPASARRSGAR
jgi:hypothetical protein